MLVDFIALRACRWLLLFAADVLNKKYKKIARGLDPSEASSYRPISNLAVLSKLLERRPSTDGLPDVRRPLAIVAVRLSPGSLD